MSKDPAFLFYSNDFLSGTFTMSNEQVGKYIRLLCLQHQKGIISDKDMLNVCGTYDEDIYSKFIKTDIGYYNERLKMESEKRSAYSESRRKNRLKRDISLSYEPRMENEDEDIDVNENDTERVKCFKNVLLELFGSLDLYPVWLDWVNYKHSQFKFRYKNGNSEITALKNLHTLSNGKTDIATAIINQSIGNGWKGFFEVKSASATNDKRYQARVDYANRHN